MESINETRDQINQIDQQIIKLLKERFMLLDDIIDYKIQEGENIENLHREREILQKVIKDSGNYCAHIKEIYQRIMNESKCYQWNFLFKENIYIIGFMAVGKTTLGKALAEKLQWDFLDTDLFIEGQEEQKIQEIFKEEGEAYFRNLEREVIKSIHQEWQVCKTKKVIACGGGIILSPENIHTMKKNGIIVHLEGDINLLYKRLLLDQTRPLLWGTEDLKNRIEVLLETRQEIYNEVADLTITVHEETPKELVQTLIRKIEYYERKRSQEE